jgi:chromosome segregation ATPase
LLADELKQVKIDLECRASKLEKLEAQLEASKQLEINNDKPKNEHLIELENCKAELIAKLQEAELQNSDLKNEVDYLMADIRDLEDQLQASIPNAHEIIHDLEVSNEELNGKIQTLESNCLSLQSEREALEKLEAENNRLQSYVASMERKCQQLEQDRCTAQEMQIALRAEEQKNLILQEELAVFTEKFAALERSHAATLSSKEDRLRAVEVENDELRSSIQQIRDELQKRIDEVHSLEERCVSLSQTSKRADAKDELLQHLQASNQQLSAKLAETEAEYRSREEEIKNLQNIIMDLEDNRNCSRALEEENAMLSDSLSSVESKHKERQTANAFLELKCMGLKMKVEDVHKLKQSIADLQQLLDTAKSEMEENSTKLTEKNDTLIQELTIVKSTLDEKESEFKRLEKFSLTLQQQTAKDVLKSEEIMEELVSSNTKISFIFAEKESEKLQLESEIESLREKISRMECTNDSQQGDFKKRSKNIEAATLRKELENSEIARISQERQLKELEDQCMRLKSFIRHQVGSPRSALNQAETSLSGTGASVTTSECREKWAKYNQSLSKLASRKESMKSGNTFPVKVTASIKNPLVCFLFL